MAITKTEEIAQIEIVQDCIIQVLLKVIITEDGQEISSSNKRYSLIPCGHTGDGVSNWVWNDTDISDQPQQVQDICNTVWTDAVKTAYKAKIEAQG
tara:strand:+ start:170 stop:457 length:288 start_codon:yes stop_codon:yes gene_type:complete